VDRLKNILLCGYRDWFTKIHSDITSDEKLNKNFNFLTCKDSDELNKILNENKIDYIFFLGWSWILEKDILDNYICICLHPSKLPLYRGGSPIQHQIINGEKISAVTFFIMDEKVDHGPIVWSCDFSLEGNLNEIFNRIADIGSKGMNEILNYIHDNNNIIAKEQNHSDSTYFKRRKPEQSEIKIEDLQNQTAEQIYNKIRALQDPYPNAYIVCKDGTKLYLQNAKFE
jgi:methionyl-tRNA formyltransferase